MSKIAFFRENDVSPSALAASVLEREGLEAIVILARIDGCWAVCWSSGVNLGSLSMAAVKFMADVQAAIHESSPKDWSEPETAA